jgi:hypothetical protein
MSAPTRRLNSRYVLVTEGKPISLCSDANNRSDAINSSDANNSSGARTAKMPATAVMPEAAGAQHSQQLMISVDIHEKSLIWLVAS